MYNELLKFAGFKSTQEANKEREKYESSDFNSLLGSPLKNKADLIRIIHMVYAWMPTMLTKFSDVKGLDDKYFDELFDLANSARRNSIKDKEDIFLKKLAKITNNHMVGASKVLMIINQEKYPIFDSRVVLAWNYFFRKKKIYGIKRLSNESILKNEKKCIDNYKFYKEKLTEWSKAESKTIRDFEFLFFHKGGKIAKEKRKDLKNKRTYDI